MSLFNILYHVIKPVKHGDFFSDWEYCCSELLQLSQKEGLKIVKFNVFFDHSDPGIYQERKQVLKKNISSLFGEACPAFGILAQAPEKPYNLVLEIGTVKCEGLNVEYKKSGDHPYVIIENGDIKGLLANGMEDADCGNSTESLARGAFEKALEILQAEKMTFDHVVRQWNYVGDILRKESINGELQQHYQVFNEVRNDYYRRFRSKNKYPAATGIGMNGKSMSIDLYAVKTSDTIKISAINSPIQIDPYDYSQKILVGPAQCYKTAPQFERAKIMKNNFVSIIFISGTASIIGQQTIGKNDVLEQTRITIENIEALISKENLHGHSLIKAGSDLNKEFRYIRVYVKKYNDIPKVKEICAQHFGNTPAVYVQSDICRDDLLVEIEGELSLTDYSNHFSNLTLSS